MVAKKRPKAGTSKAEAAKRRALFVEAYVSNGGNATEAAKTAGFSAKTAKQQGSRLLTDVDVRAEIEGRRAQAIAAAEKITGISVERTLQEVARVAYFDHRKLFNADGSMKGPHEWDAETAAAISHFSRGGWVPFDKNAALEKAMKYLGLYEKDNNQQPVPTTVSIHVVGVQPTKR